MFDQINPAVHGSNRRHDAAVASAFSAAVIAADREELSRGLQAGDSLRQIAARLGRAVSTISREVAWNGQRDAYRAWRAEQTAARRARRPKPEKLATHPRCVVKWSVAFSSAGHRNRSRRGSSVTILMIGRCACRTRRSTVAVRAGPRGAAQSAGHLSAYRAHAATLAPAHGAFRDRPAAPHGLDQRPPRGRSGPRRSPGIGRAI